MFWGSRGDCVDVLAIQNATIILVAVGAIMLLRDLFRARPPYVGNTNRLRLWIVCRFGKDFGAATSDANSGHSYAFVSARTNVVCKR